MAEILRTGVVYAPKTLGDVLRHEQNPLYSRRTRAVGAPDGADVDLEVGTVLGRRLLGAPVSEAAVGNTGNGTVGDLALAVGALAGVYSLIATAATVFTVVDPMGRRLADLVVGSAYDAGGLALTITAGATPFDAGDTITVTVPVGDKVFVPLVDGAHDGSGRAQGVLAAAVTVPDGETVRVTVISGGSSAVIADGLVWPDGIDAAAVTAAHDALDAVGILVLQ